jgi:hypothetical protein
MSQVTMCWIVSFSCIRTIMERSTKNNLYIFKPSIDPFRSVNVGVFPSCTEYIDIYFEFVQFFIRDSRTTDLTFEKTSDVDFVRMIQFCPQLTRLSLSGGLFE